MRILVIEDEALIADLIAETLERAGHEIVALCGSLAKAEQALAEVSMDVTVLDANLRGESTEHLATDLQRRGVPVIVISGYEAAELSGALRSAPALRKPFSPSRLIDAINEAGAAD